MQTKAQVYQSNDIVGKWELSDKKAQIVFNKNMTFSYTWKGLTKEDSFSGTYKLLSANGKTIIEFKRDNGVAWPKRNIKSLSDDRKTMELKIGTLTETYKKL